MKPPVSCPWTQKIVSTTKVVGEFSPWRGKYPLVTTNGCFDILHQGHLHLLLHCSQLSPYTVVLLNSDTSVKHLKGPSRPIQDEQTRARVLACLVMVWRVVIFSEHTPVEVLRVLKPDIHIKGADYQDQVLPEADLLKKMGGRLEFCPLLPGISTTHVLKKHS